MLHAHLMDDHCEALFHWKELGLSGATCVHVDLHLDVNDDGFPSGWLEALAQVRTRAEMEPFVGGGFLPWGGLNCGNFLSPALAEGLVTHLVWVVPDWLFEPEPLAWARTELGSWPRLTYVELGELRLHEGRVEGRLKGRRLTLCTAANLPPLGQPLLLDVDVDYFINPQDELWCTPAQLHSRLGLTPAVLTVATSVAGGFTPSQYASLGRETLLLWGGQAGSGRIRPLAQAADEPRTARSWDRALAEFHRGSFPAAHEWLQRAIQERPQDTPACTYLVGLMEFDSDRPLGAVAAWEPLTRWPGLSEDDLAYLRLRLARALRQLDRAEEAAFQCRLGLLGRPGDAKLLHEYGLARAAQGLLEPAVRLFSQALRAAPETLHSLQVREDLATVYERQGRAGLARSQRARVARLTRPGREGQ